MPVSKTIIHITQEVPIGVRMVPIRFFGEVQETATPQVEDYGSGEITFWHYEYEVLMMAFDTDGLERGSVAMVNEWAEYHFEKMKEKFIETYINQ